MAIRDFFRSEHERDRDRRRDEREHPQAYGQSGRRDWAQGDEEREWRRRDEGYGTRGSPRYGGGFYEGEEHSDPRFRAPPSGGVSPEMGAQDYESHRGRGPRGYQRSDERIREEACECLTDDPHVDASEMDVAVKNGEVTLTGTVTSREQKRRAADLIDGLAGVKDVHNHLRIASGSPQQDAPAQPRH